MRVFSVIFLLNTFLMSSCDAQKISYDRLTEMDLVDMQGEKFNIQQYQGKKIFVNFWATWCGPCVQEFPTIESASHKLKNDFIFLAISDEPLDKINAFLANKNFTIIFLKQNLKEGAKLRNSLPLNHVLNSKGKSVYSRNNSAKWDSDEMITMLEGVK